MCLASPASVLPTWLLPSLRPRGGEIVGIRPGEKIHEEMITETDGLNTLEFSQYFVILPRMPFWDAEKYRQQFQGQRCEFGFRYNSGTNTQWLSVPEITGTHSAALRPDFPAVVNGRASLAGLLDQ